MVYLFKENIDNYAKQRGRSADNIFAYVYVHEAMHAYYDSMNSEEGHVVHELEEAFAECGMLEFLTNACFHDKDLCEPAIDAYDDVNEKGRTVLMNTASVCLSMNYHTRLEKNRRHDEPVPWNLQLDNW